jgi:hypothetical protein
MEKTVSIDHKEFGMMAEAIHELWGSIEDGETIGAEVQVEMEDGNAVVWETEKLLDMAGHCDVSLGGTSCERFGLEKGSTYKDAARAIRHRLSDVAISG